jgi:hypothetical protein
MYWTDGDAVCHQFFVPVYMHFIFEAMPLVAVCSPNSGPLGDLYRMANVTAMCHFERTFSGSMPGKQRPDWPSVQAAW